MMTEEVMREILGDLISIADIMHGIAKKVGFETIVTVEASETGYAMCSICEFFSKDYKELKHTSVNRYSHDMQWKEIKQIEYTRTGKTCEKVLGNIRTEAVAVGMPDDADGREQAISGD